MNCKEYEKYGALFLSGELNKDDTQNFQKHLTECQECSEKAAFESDILSGEREVVIKVPAGLDDSILKSLDLKKDTIFNRRYTIYSIAASIILAVIISLSVFNNTQQINIDPVNIIDQNVTEISENYDIFDDDLLLAYDELYDDDFDNTYDLMGEEQDLSYDDELYENVALLESIY